VPPIIDPGVVAEHSIGLGTLPAISARLFSLLGEASKASVSDVEQLVRPDVGLTANLLRYANTAANRGVSRVTTVKEAVVRLGARQVLEVALGASLSRLIPPRLLGYGTTADEFWGHSVAVALISDRLGRETGFASADLAFTAGLLHDLGKVVLATYLTTGAGMAARDVGALGSVAVEREKLGTDHTEIGEAVGVKWQLPAEICAVARWHHAPQQAPKASQRLLTAAIALADGLAKQGLGMEPGAKDLRALVDAVDRDVLVTLSLTQNRLERLLADSVAEIERTRQAWGAALR
jgi:HD-like signal output (HDOD) protein